MRLIGIREFRATLATILDESQAAPTIIMERGKPRALLVGVDGQDDLAALVRFGERMQSEAKKKAPKGSRTGRTAG